MSIAPEISPTSVKRLNPNYLGNGKSGFNSQEMKSKDHFQDKVHDSTSMIIACQDKYKKIIIHKVYLIIFIVFYSYSILYDYLRIMLFSRESNYISFGVNIFIIIIFFLDLCFNTMFIKGYLCSLYFYIDLISTCSLILKIDWVIQAKSPIIVLTLSLLSKTRIASFIKIGNHFYNTERFHDQNAKENEIGRASCRERV